MTPQTELRRLRERVRKLEDENAALQYWAQVHYNWAVGHNAERMADLDRHREELRRVLELKQFDRERYHRMIQREAKRLFARCRKRNKARRLTQSHDSSRVRS